MLTSVSIGIIIDQKTITSNQEAPVFMQFIHSFFSSPEQAEHDGCKQLPSEVILFKLMSSERGADSAFAYKRLWWMTPVPAAHTVISVTPDRREVLQENGKLIYLNFHQQQGVHGLRTASVRFLSRSSGETRL